MKIAERTATWRRERRVLLRVSRAAWRLEQAERERSWALASARAEGVSIRALAAAAGLSSSRVTRSRPPPTSMSWTRRWVSCGLRAGRCCLTRGTNAVGGWPSRTWSSGPSAPGGGCPLPRPRNWSGPGMPGRPSATSAAKSANGPATLITRSGRANGPPVRQRAPGPFRELDAIAVLTGPLLPPPRCGDTPGYAHGGRGRGRLRPGWVPRRLRAHRRRVPGVVRPGGAAASPASGAGTSCAGRASSGCSGG